MGMGPSGGGNLKSEINITPLVDVVLVLLIIFMVIVPLTQVGHPVVTPPKQDNPQVNTLPPPDQLIIRIDASGKYFLNKQEIPPAEFPTRLAEAAKNRSADKPIFFAADGELPYGTVAEFLDLCRNNGAKNIGIVFTDLSG